jgi:DNA-binding MarR family transcriptional regulator/RimJ/RimL family protein N-acetyltransferase
MTKKLIILFDLNLIDRIKRLSGYLNNQSRDLYAYEKYEIDPNWHLIFLLIKNKPLTVTEIAARLQLSHPAIIKIIKKMKHLGYISSSSDINDSRKTILLLTSKSKKLLPQLELGWGKVAYIFKECSNDDFLKNILSLEENIKDKSLLKRYKSNIMRIVNSTPEDCPKIMKIYNDATNYMVSKKQVSWPKFSKKMILKEIQEKRHWKLLIEDEIACVWVTTFSDPIIWKEKNVDPSVYIHRIATNKKFRGNKLSKELVFWVKKYAENNKKKFIRMDTVGHNKSLIRLYEQIGFQFLGGEKLEDINGLPSHYNKGDVCFFEIQL